MTIQATLAMRPFKPSIQTCYFCTTCYVGFVQPSSRPSPSSYSEYFIPRGCLRCSARVLKYPFLRCPDLLQITGSLLKGKSKTLLILRIIITQVIRLFSQLMNASIKYRSISVPDVSLSGSIVTSS